MNTFCSAGRNDGAAVSSEAFGKARDQLRTRSD